MVMNLKVVIHFWAYSSPLVAMIKSTSTCDSAPALLIEHTC